MSDHTDMMLNRAIASADFDAYREDAKDDRIAALEAELAAEKQRHANNHAAWTAANEELRDAHQRSLNERDAYRAQLQSVTADRDFYEAVVTEAHEALDLWQGIDENHGVPERINIVRRHEALAGDQMEAAINALVAERDAARQSRARLVRLVRRRRDDLEMATEDVATARAWAAAWKRAAKRWQNELLTPRTVTFRVEKELSQSSIDRRAQRRAERITSNRRAAEAAEAQERR